MTPAEIASVVTALAVLLGLAHLGTRLLDRLDSPRRRYGRGSRSRTTEVREGERASVTGRLYALGDELQPSWLDGRPLLIRDSSLMEYDSGSEEHDPWRERVLQQTRPQRAVLRDEVGELLVLFAGQEIWLDRQTRRARGVTKERVIAFLASTGKRPDEIAPGLLVDTDILPDGYELRERALEVGDEVRVVGRVVRLPPEDPAAGTLVLAAGERAPLYICSPRQETSG
jgi:hypothetical protein